MNDITELALIAGILRNCSLLEELIHTTPLTDFDGLILDELKKANKQFSIMHAKYKESRERAREEMVENIKELIETSGLKQYIVAEKAGINPAFLSMILNGHRALNPDVNEKLLKVLDHDN